MNVLNLHGKWDIAYSLGLNVAGVRSRPCHFCGKRWPLIWELGVSILILDGILKFFFHIEGKKTSVELIFAAKLCGCFDLTFVFGSWRYQKATWCGETIDRGRVWSWKISLSVDELKMHGSWPSSYTYVEVYQQDRERIQLPASPFLKWHGQDMTLQTSKMLPCLSYYTLACIVGNWLFSFFVMDRKLI